MVEGAEQRQGLTDGELVGQARFLERDADALADGLIVVAPA